GAARGRGRGGPAGPGARGAPPAPAAGREPASTRRASPAAPRAPLPATPRDAADVDLFGAPVARPAAAAVIETEEGKAPAPTIENPFEDELHPAGVDARVEIVPASHVPLETIPARAPAGRGGGVCGARAQARPGDGPGGGG